MALDTILWLAGDGATAFVVAVIARRRIYRTLPVFSAYLVWSLASDLGQFALARYYPALNYNVYLIGLVVDSCFQFGVLIELFWSVLRPLRAALPPWSLPAVAALIALISVAVWPFASLSGVNDFSMVGRLMFHVQETFSILRILFFLLLAGCSQLLSIGWRDRELQIATGLGFYSLVSLAVWMQHRTGPQYHLLDQMVAASYICSLVYWSFAFALKESERRDFTPQMQSFLLSVAGTARSTRIALPDSLAPKNANRRK